MERVREFGEFRLDPAQRMLFRRGEAVVLPPKAIDLLIALTDEPGRLCAKEELMRRVWPDVAVEEANLTQNIFLLRKALGSDEWIVTVPRRGYRFVGPSATGKRNPILIIAGIVVVVAIIAIVGWIAWRRPAVSPIHSIAVLPFRPVDDRGRDPAFELGIADTLINKLSQLPGIAVTPSRAIGTYQKATADPIVAGRELRVDGVVEGNIQRDGRRVRSTVRLLRVSDGTAIWADRFDEDASDLFDLEDRIAEQVAGALHVRLDPAAERSLRKRPTDNLEAYRLYQQGHFAWTQFTEEGREASIRFYRAALQIDPNYALAYAGIAKTYTLTGIYGPMAPDEAFARARETATRALQLDPNIGEAHVALAATAIFHDWDWRVAQNELDRASELEPNLADLHSLKGYFLEATGRTAAAVDEERRARELDPLWTIAQNDYVKALYLDRRYDDTIREGLRYLELQPKDVFVRHYVVRAMISAGRLDQAAAQATTLIGIAPNSVRPIAVTGEVAALRGDRAGAAKVIERIEREYGTDFRADYNVALIHTALGNHDAAFASLDKAYRSRYPFLWEMRVDPLFDPLRSDPRYSQLLAKMSLK